MIAVGQFPPRGPARSRAAGTPCRTRFSDLPRTARGYVYANFVAAMATAVWVLTRGGLVVDASVVLLCVAWVAVGALAYPVPAAAHTMSPSSIVAVAAVLLVSPRAAILVACVGQAIWGLLISRQEWFRRAFNVANMTLSTAAAGGAAMAVSSFASDSRSGVGLLLVGLAAAATFCVVNDMLLAVVVGLARTIDARDSQLFAPRTFVASVALALLGVAVASLWETNPWLLATMAAPVVFGMQSWVVPVLREETRTESKTGLFSAAHFQERLDYEFARATRTSRDVSVLMADVDHFRQVNTQHGHLAGDAVLIGIADILRREVRRGGTASRFGGEEFAVLLPETDGEAAVRIAERIRAAVEHAEFVSDASDTPLRATISIGVATASPRAGTAVAVLDEADRALYRAKREGRNRVARLDDADEHAEPAAVPLGALV
jgi:diguanylate cyclase (GGDEF)-like protein